MDTKTSHQLDNMNTGELIFFCGKMGAGKSTKAKEIASGDHAVLLSEDEWLMALYPDAIHSLDDYLLYSNRLKPQMKKTIQSILRTGSSVVLDYPANTPAQRAWFKSIYAEVHAPHRLLYLDVTDDVCLERIAKRRVEQPERTKTDTPEMFAQVTKYFTAPSNEEGFNVIRYTP